MVSSEHSKYLVANYAAPAIEIVRGEGTKVWDSDGKEYLDFTTGIAVATLVTVIPIGYKPYHLRQTNWSTVPIFFPSRNR